MVYDLLTPAVRTRRRIARWAMALTSAAVVSGAVALPASASATSPAPASVVNLVADGNGRLIDPSEAWGDGGGSAIDETYCRRNGGCNVGADTDHEPGGGIFDPPRGESDTEPGDGRRGHPDPDPDGDGAGTLIGWSECSVFDASGCPPNVRT
ncbi:hypothetical protein [Streptomyces sp. NPDC059874]|uniref:hypothetical protein n=1 Tax=Streptomyces sp. NPDC059874 TaxID=3346983 RepID=UPI00365ACB3F